MAHICGLHLWFPLDCVVLNQLNWSLGVGGVCDYDLDRNTGYLSLQKLLLQILLGQLVPTDHHGVRAKAVALGSSWAHLLQPPSHTAASELPRMPIRAGPIWSEPLHVSPQWRGLPHWLRAPPCVLTTEGPLYTSSPPSMRVFFQQHQADTPLHPPTNHFLSSLPLFVTRQTLIHLFKPTAVVTYARDARPGAHMRINHPRALPGTTSVAAPLTQGGG